MNHLSGLWEKTKAFTLISMWGQVLQGRDRPLKWCFHSVVQTTESKTLQLSILGIIISLHLATKESIGANTLLQHLRWSIPTVTELLSAKVSQITPQTRSRILCKPQLSVKLSFFNLRKLKSKTWSRLICFCTQILNKGWIICSYHHMNRRCWIWNLLST